MLFDTEKEELNKDNVIVVDDDKNGLIGGEKQNIKAVEKLAKQQAELNRKTDPTTAEGIGKLSSEDKKILDKIDAKAAVSKFFGWITTLIHENVHVQGDPSEDKTYQKEVDSFKEHEGKEPK